MRENTGGRGLGRRVLRVVLIVALFVVAGLAANRQQVLQWWAQRTGQDREPTPITLYPYNFTGRNLDYAIGSALLAYLPAGAADGRTVLKQGYTPPSDDAPLPVRWRYVDGDAAAPRSGDYPYGATLKLPARPSGDAVLTLRFYPDGKVAARYTTRPEVADGGSVDAGLRGPGWQSNR